MGTMPTLPSKEPWEMITACMRIRSYVDSFAFSWEMPDKRLGYVEWQFGLGLV